MLSQFYTLKSAFKPKALYKSVAVAIDAFSYVNHPVGLLFTDTLAEMMLHLNDCMTIANAAFLYQSYVQLKTDFLTKM